MERSLTRGEYWLLETVVEWGCPLCFTASESYVHDSSIEGMFNKTGHGLDRARLIETLGRLLDEGLIETLRDKKPVRLTREQLAAELLEIPPPRERSSLTYYRLTQKGGAVWEEFAAPDWERFMKTEWDDESQTGSVTCMTSWRVKKYLRYTNLVNYELDTPSVQWDELGDWEATYWKTLPRGHQAQFKWLREIEEGGPSDELAWLAFCGLNRFEDEWCRWR